MKLLISTAILAAAIPSSLAAQTFNFEGASTATVTSYTATQSGLTLTLNRQGGKSFGLTDLSSTIPSWGNRSLSPFDDATTGAFVANFSTGLSYFQFEAGDFAPSDLDVITLDIYSGLNGTGTILGTQTLNYGGSGLPTIAILSLTSATPFLSAVFNGGSSGFPNSVFYDNIIVRQAEAAGVPEPATWAMMMIGFGAVGGVMRRRAKLTVRYA